MPRIIAVIPNEKLIEGYPDTPIELDRISARTMIIGEKQITTLHKFGDYFNAIEQQANDTNFLLIFDVKDFSERPKENSSYWKDLMLKVIWEYTGRRFFPTLEKG